MGSWAPTPNSAASFLLSLDERAMDGIVPLGGRRILLRRGRVVDITRGEGDTSVAEFLRATGRIDESVLRRIGKEAEAQAVLDFVALPVETLEEAIRTVWLDRLVRALQSGGPAPTIIAGDVPSRGAAEVNLAVLVLDALERLGSGDAEEVGARSNATIEWGDSPLTARAQRWLGVEGARARRVSGVLAAQPGAAARLAALARVGLVQVSEVTAAAASPVGKSAPPPSLDVPRESLPAFRPPELELAPGAGIIAQRSLPPAVELPRFPPATERLDDPLDALERKIERLELEQASATERARAWRALGDAWLRVHGAIEETARCMREAAALDKNDVDLLQKTADACAAVGQLDVALAYGRAAVAASHSAEARSAALMWYALFCRRSDRPSDALGAARAAQSLGEASPEPFALAAELEESHQLLAEAVRDRLEAASIARETHPDRAHAWLSQAWLAETGDPRAAEAFAASLASRGSIDLALAIRAETARRAPDVEQRRRSLLALAERAELAERPLLAVDFQLEVLETEPVLEVLHDAVDEDLQSAGLTVEQALVLEDLGHRTDGDTKGELYVRAADARNLARLNPEWTLVLLRRALLLGVPLSRARSLMESLRASLGSAIVCDVLEDVAHAVREGTDRRALLDLLISWGGGVPGGGRRLAQVMRERRIPEPSALLAQEDSEKSALAAAEARRERASGSARRSATLELAHLLAATHQGRESALVLAEEVLAEVPSDDAEDLALRLALVRADGAAILRCASRLGARGGSPEKRERALVLALAAATELDRSEEGRDAAMRLQRLSPPGAETAIRMRRLGSRTGDVELAVHGLRAESVLPLSAKARARSWARLAALALENGAVSEAARAAEEALQLVPTEGLATLVALRAISRGESSSSLVERVLDVVGDIPLLLAAVARGQTDAARSLAATVRWASLDPTSPEPPLTALEECLARGVDDYLEPGLHALLTDARATPRALTAIGRAVLRMAEHGANARAAELARRAAMYFGRLGDPLRPMALDLGRREAESFHERAALELLLPPREALVARVEHLEKMASIARNGGDRAAEIRTLLRVLSTTPREPMTIARLSHLFAETGETERLFATLELLTEGGSEAERAQALLSLAAAANQLLGSSDRAAEYVDRLAALQGNGSPEKRVLARADALVALGRVSEAVDDLVRAAEAPEGTTSRGGRGKLFERAADLALRHLADPERALGIAAEGLRSEGVWTGPTLLLFEQLSLARKRTDLAEDVYRALVQGAMGERGKRALAYRRARWLERVGDKRAALDALVEAASHEGASGAVSTALERVARDVGDLDALARGYLALASAARHPVLRGDLIHRAARVWEMETGHPERAFEALVGEWKKTFQSDLEPDLARLANAVAEGNAAAGDAAYAQLFTEIERHAGDAWMGDEKARLLMKAARLHAARGKPDEAATRAREAIAALEGEDAEMARVADVWVELAGFELARGLEPAARAAVLSALALEPAHEKALALAARLGVTPPPKASVPPELAPAAEKPRSAPPPAAEAASPQTAAVLQAEGDSAPAVPPTAASHVSSAPESPARAPSGPPPASVPPNMAAELGAIAEGLEIEGLPLDLTGLGTARASETPPRAPRAPVALPHDLVDDADLPARPSRLDSWIPLSKPPGPSKPATLPPIARVNSLPPPAGESTDEFAMRLAGSPQTVVSAAAVLRGILMESPGRHDVLVKLATISDGHPELIRVHRVASGLLSLSSETPVPKATEVGDADARSLIERLTQVGALTAPFSILERLAEGLPTYRQSLGQLGVVGTDRVAAHGAAPVSKALARVLALRGVSPDATPVFLSSRPGGLPAVIRTSPGSILVPIDWSRSESELRFAIARAMELAQPRSILLATLPLADAGTLFDAVRAAFGPADGGRVDKNAAQLAAELWRSLSVRVQRDMRELVHQAGPSWDVTAMRTATLATATRAGLLCTGDARTALSALLKARARTDGQPTSGDAWSSLVEGDPEVADLVRVAISDDFIGALRI